MEAAGGGRKAEGGRKKEDGRRKNFNDLGIEHATSDAARVFA